MVFSAFVGWQVLKGNGLKQDFDKYLKTLGLKESLKASKDELKKESAEAIKKAEDLINRYRGKNG